jgi:hypothetical protein
MASFLSYFKKLWNWSSVLCYSSFFKKIQNWGALLNLNWPWLVTNMTNNFFAVLNLNLFTVRNGLMRNIIPFWNIQSFGLRYSMHKIPDSFTMSNVTKAASNRPPLAVADTLYDSIVWRGEAGVNRQGGERAEKLKKWGKNTKIAATKPERSSGTDTVIQSGGQVGWCVTMACMLSKSLLYIPLHSNTWIYHRYAESRYVPRSRTFVTCKNALLLWTKAWPSHVTAVYFWGQGLNVFCGVTVMRDGRQRHGHVLMSLMMLWTVIVDFYGVLVHTVPELWIGTSGVPFRDDFGQVLWNLYIGVFTYVHIPCTSPCWQAQAVWKI